MAIDFIERLLRAVNAYQLVQIFRCGLYLPPQCIPIRRMFPDGIQHDAAQVADQLRIKIMPTDRVQLHVNHRARAVIDRIPSIVVSRHHISISPGATIKIIASRAAAEFIVAVSQLNYVVPCTTINPIGRESIRAIHGRSIHRIVTGYHIITRTSHDQLGCRTLQTDRIGVVTSPDIFNHD